MEEKKELAERARAGDKEAFGALYETVYEDLYRFALYSLKNTYDAQDAVAEAVADAYAGIRKLREPEAFRGWIFQILFNKCRKKRKEYIVKDAELREAAGFRQEEDLDRKIQLWQAFGELTREERLIISMKLFGGYKSGEIGKLLCRNQNTVRSRFHRALKKMEEKLR